MRKKNGGRNVKTKLKHVSGAFGQRKFPSVRTRPGVQAAAAAAAASQPASQRARRVLDRPEVGRYRPTFGETLGDIAG